MVYVPKLNALMFIFGSGHYEMRSFLNLYTQCILFSYLLAFFVSTSKGLYSLGLNKDKGERRGSSRDPSMEKEGMEMVIVMIK